MGGRLGAGLCSLDHQLAAIANLGAEHVTNQQAGALDFGHGQTAKNLFALAPGHDHARGLEDGKVLRQVWF